MPGTTGTSTPASSVINATPDYGPNGRQARTKNYYYFYTKVDDRTCTIWALPIGPRRHYAPSIFAVLLSKWMRIWKGKSLDDDVIEKLPDVPRLDQLLELTMKEYSKRVFHQR